MASYEEVMKRLASKSKTAWLPAGTALEAGGRAKTDAEWAEIDPDDNDREAEAKKREQIAEAKKREQIAEAKKKEITNQIAEAKKRLQDLEKQYREVR